MWGNKDIMRFYSLQFKREEEEANGNKIKLFSSFLILIKSPENQHFRNMLVTKERKDL